jgi:CDP-glucose 4,6-dehydratase
MDWKKKNILITGMSGFLAPHIADKIVKLGGNVIGGIHDEKKTCYYRISGLGKLMTIVDLDIGDLQRIKEVITNYEINFIFHCAANSIVKNCVKNPIGAFSVNILGTANILEAARTIGNIEGIMCMESDKSYGSFEKNQLPYKETDGVKPKNVYEVSKACSGLIAETYSYNYNLPVFTVRAANLYGPGDMNTSRLIPGSILRSLNKEDPILYSGVAQYVREFLYVEDAADAIIKLMENINLTKSNIYNIGSGAIHSIEKVMKMLLLATPGQSKVRIVEKDALYKEIEEQYVDYSKMLSIVPNFSPRNLEVGLKETVIWYKKNKNNLPLPP